MHRLTLTLSLALVLLPLSHSAAAQKRKGSDPRVQKQPTSKGETEVARSEFRQTHPCPFNGKTSGPCRGYVIGYKIPLNRGGANTAFNMQWEIKAMRPK